MRYLSNFISNIKLLFMRSLSDNLGRNSHRDIYSWLMKVEHGVNSNKCLLNDMYPRHLKNIERIESLENERDEARQYYKAYDTCILSLEKDIKDIKSACTQNYNDILEGGVKTRDDINDIKENIKALQLFLMEYNHCFLEKKKDK